LFSDPVLSARIIASNETHMAMNDDKGRAWEEVIKAYFKVVFCILFLSAKQNYLNQDNYLTFEDIKWDHHTYFMCYSCTNML
jgi:hypothetical protein